MQTLVLSSTSPARRELLSRLQRPFEINSPDVDETPLPHEDAKSLVLRLAILKAQASAEKYPGALIIGADQVGILDHHILGKPLTVEAAFNTLKLVSGKKISFLTGICLLNAATGKYQTAVELYNVYFRKLSDTVIREYLNKEQPLHCAGSFHVEGLGISLIEKLEGDDYTSLIGLPLIKLTRMLSTID